MYGNEHFRKAAQPYGTIFIGTLGRIKHSISFDEAMSMGNHKQVKI